MRDWQKYFDEFTPASGLRDEAAAIRVCQLAALAARLGTYGVGAVLLDSNGEIVVEGHNEVHVNAFRSDLHAEMVVMNAFETARPGLHDLDGHTDYVPRTLPDVYDAAHLCRRRNDIARLRRSAGRNGAAQVVAAAGISADYRKPLSGVGSGGLFAGAARGRVRYMGSEQRGSGPPSRQSRKLGCRRRLTTRVRCQMTCKVSASALLR